MQQQKTLQTLQNHWHKTLADLWNVALDDVSPCGSRSFAAVTVPTPGKYGAFELPSINPAKMLPESGRRKLENHLAVEGILRFRNVKFYSDMNSDNSFIWDLKAATQPLPTADCGHAGAAWRDGHESRANVVG